MRAFRLPSFSYWPTVMGCDGAAVLPKAYDPEEERRWADRGITIHWFLRRVGHVGLEKALAEVVEEWRLQCAMIPLELLPVGVEYEKELAVAFNLETGEAIRIPPAVDGVPDEERYAAARALVGDSPWWVFGTIDSARLLSALHAYVADYKTGFLRTDFTWQLRFEAMAFAALTGATTVTAVKIRFDEDMEPREEEHTWDLLQLEMWREEALTKARGWFARHGRLAQVPVDATEVRPDKETCRHCKSYDFCPRTLALTRARTEDLEAEANARINGRSVADVWRFAGELETLAKRLKSEAYRFGAHETVDLGDGELLGMHAKEEKDWNGGVVFEVLRGHFADQVTPEQALEIAQAGVTLESSHAGLKRGVQKAYELGLVKPRGITEKVRELVSEVAKRGGLTRTEKETVHVYRAKAAALPPGAPVEKRTKAA